MGSRGCGRDGVDAVFVKSMDVGILCVVFASWVIGYVLALIVEVFAVSDAVFVMAGVPDLSCGLFADGEGVAAFDELYAPRC